MVQPQFEVNFSSLRRFEIALKGRSIEKEDGRSAVMGKLIDYLSSCGSTDNLLMLLLLLICYCGQLLAMNEALEKIHMLASAPRRNCRPSNL